MDIELQSFLDYHKNTKLTSENTILAYKSDLLQFKDFINSKGVISLSGATETHLFSFLMKLRTENKSQSTLYRKKIAITGFLNFIYNEGITKSKPSNKLSIPQGKSKTIDFLSVEEIDKLFASIGDDHRGKRDKAILEMLYGTGIRVSELVSLKIYNINFELSFLTCDNENGTQRLLPLGKLAKESVIDYLNNAYSSLQPAKLSDDTYNKDNFLFLNYRGQPFTRQGIWKVIKQHAQTANLEKKMTPRTLRNSFAIHVLQNGADIKTVQDILGVENTRAIEEAYYNSKERKIKEIFNKTHPRA